MIVFPKKEVIEDLLAPKIGMEQAVIKYVTGARHKSRQK